MGYRLSDDDLCSRERAWDTYSKASTNMHMLSFVFSARWQYRTHLEQLSGRFEDINPAFCGNGIISSQRNASALSVLSAPAFCPSASLFSFLPLSPAVDAFSAALFCFPVSKDRCGNSRTVL